MSSLDPADRDPANRGFDDLDPDDLDPDNLDPDNPFPNGDPLNDTEPNKDLIMSDNQSENEEVHTDTEGEDGGREVQDEDGGQQEVGLEEEPQPSTSTR
jgi:hypothetical protein